MRMSLIPLTAVTPERRNEAQEALLQAFKTKQEDQGLEVPSSKSDVKEINERLQRVEVI